MKWIVPACIALLLCQSTASADEIQQAVDLLSISLKCPIKPYSVHGNGDGHFARTIAKYTGTKAKLAITIEERIDNEQVDDRSTLTASYRELSPATVSESPFEVFADGRPAFDVQLNCLGGSQCIAENGQLQMQESFYSFIVCDQDTAENIKIAINTLIRLNR